jgi:hypothetical protein
VGFSGVETTDALIVWPAADDAQLNAVAANTREHAAADAARRSRAARKPSSDFLNLMDCSIWATPSRSICEDSSGAAPRF